MSIARVKLATAVLSPNIRTLNTYVWFRNMNPVYCRCSVLIVICQHEAAMLTHDRNFVLWNRCKSFSTFLGFSWSVIIVWFNFRESKHSRHLQTFLFLLSGNYIPLHHLIYLFFNTIEVLFSDWILMNVERSIVVELDLMFVLVSPLDEHRFSYLLKVLLLARGSYRNRKFPGRSK
jgi:hypothetical protein